MKIEKVILPLAAGALLCAALCSCVGGGDNTDGTTEKATTEKSTTEAATTAPETGSGIVDEVVGDVSEALTTESGTTGTTNQGAGRMRSGMRGRDGK